MRTPELEPGERLLERVPGYRIVGMFKVGGELLITNRRIRFAPSTLGLTRRLRGRYAVDVPISEIAGTHELGWRERILSGNPFMDVWDLVLNSGRMIRLRTARGDQLTYTIDELLRSES